MACDYIEVDQQMVNWADIDTVLLDMDGTLLDLHFDNHFWLRHLPERYAGIKNIPLAEAREQLETLSDALHGHLNWYCIDHWSEVLALDIMSLKQEVAHLIRYRADSEAFLRFLRAQDKQIVLVTNAHPCALALKLAASGLESHLDARYSTHTFGLAKENPGFWPLLQAAGNFDYQRCLFIDDSINVLRRARAEGPSLSLQVLQPDSTQAQRPASEFTGFNHFAELMHP